MPSRVTASSDIMRANSPRNAEGAGGGDGDDRIRLEAVARGGERSEPAEGVTDDGEERAVPALQCGERGDPVAHVGARSAGCAVGGRVERDHAVAVGDEAAHQWRELRRPAAPSVGEHDDRADVTPAIGGDADAAYLQPPTRGPVHGGRVAGVQLQARTRREEGAVRDVRAEPRRDRPRRRDGGRATSIPVAITAPIYRTIVRMPLGELYIPNDRT